MLAEVSPFVDSLQHIIGFLVVLFVLAILWAVTALLGIYFQRLAPVKATAPPASGGGSDEPSEEEVVAITAAISMLMGRRSRIVSLGSAKKDWSQEGRREHMASHKIR
jgi:Na+-transporting methylmalonyl-CoA/oxaloacetate decarboxylase gamma subunit